MDLVYPLGTGTTWENNELRYSLRSVAENLLDVGTIWVVGECPSWLQNVRCIKYPDVGGIPWRNSFAKLVRACKEPDLTAEFLYMNDDFFINRPYLASEWPIMSRGNLPAGVRTSRLKSLNNKNNTTGLLVSKKLTTNDFELHAPIRLEKQKVLDLPIDTTFPSGFHPRSYYGNYWGLKPIIHEEVLVGPRRDLQELKDYLEGKEFFALMTHAGKDWKVRQFIKTRWPNPSKYEL